MQVGRPKLVIVLTVIAVRVVAYPRNIVRERVKPNVNDVSVVEVHGHAPLERRSRYAKVLQAFQKEIVHHLVLTRNGLNELGMGVDVLD